MACLCPGQPCDPCCASQVLISQEHLQLEPIGLVFVFFFALILIIQFVAMLFHRFGTISHILASTELTCCNKKVRLIEIIHVLDVASLSTSSVVQLHLAVLYEKEIPMNCSTANLLLTFLVSADRRVSVSG